MKRDSSPIHQDGLAGFSRPWLAGALLFVLILAIRIYDARDFLATGINHDPDSVMRLIQVRDWLAGQGWFDLHQHRMGNDLLMHWSRLADLLPAGLILLFRPLAGTAQAELIAQALTPLIWLAPALLLTVLVARNLAGPAATLPAMLVTLMGESALTLFTPGMIDHHTMQLLALLLLLWAATGARQRIHGAIAGAAIVISFTIGLETAPHMLACLLVVAGLWIARPRQEQRFLTGLSAGLMAFTLLAMWLFMPRPWPWHYCDGWTPGPAFACIGFAFICGICAALTPRLAGNGRAWLRAAVGAGLVAATGTGIAIMIPACTHHPYGNDPLIWRFWLDHITELRTPWSMMREAGFAYGYVYIAAVPAIIMAALWVLRQDIKTRLHWLFPLAALLVGLAITLTQLRGHALMTASSLPLAAALIARWRAAGGWQRFACWLIFPAYPYFIACYYLDRPAFSHVESDTRQVYCAQPATLAALNALPPSRLLIPLHAEPQILLNTRHVSIAGVYHRNIFGIGGLIHAMAASPADAAPMVRALRADYILMCPGYAIDTVMAVQLPTSLAAALARNEPPPWLEVVQRLPHGVILYKVK